MNNLHLDLDDQKVINLALSALERRCRERDNRTVPEDLYAHFTLVMGEFEEERFHVAYLDTLGRLIAINEVSVGTLTASTIYVREIVKLAVIHNAAYAVLAHNHPSGRAGPSKADKDLTDVIVKKLATLDVVVADHIIVGGSKFYSFKAGGLL